MEMSTELEGRVVWRVRKTPDGDRLLVDLVGGTTLRYEAEGDCCSQSWVEHIEAPPDLGQGALVTGVDESSGAEPYGSHHCDRDCEHDVLEVYNTTIHTTRGDIVVEYRNDSNGYYGGWLRFVAEEPTGEDSI